MHRADYTDKLVIRYKKVTRIVHAKWQSKKMSEPLELDVLQENEDLITKCRNVVYSRMGGYGIIFPKERVDYYGNGQIDIFPLDNYGLTENNGRKRLPLFCNNKPTKEDLETVLSKYPDFQKVIDTKQLVSNMAVMSALYYWKKDKETFIFLLSRKLYSLCYSESFYKLSEKKKNEIVSFIKNYKGDIPDIDTSKFYKTIQLMKEFKDYSFFDMFCVNFGFYTKKEESLSFFKKTSEYKLLSETEQKNFDSFFLTNPNYHLDNFTYAKFRRLIKDKISYPLTSFSDLIDIRYNDMPKDKYVSFLNLYNKDFCYTIAKAEKAINYINVDVVNKIFQIWKKYPRDIEGLCSLRLSSLILNESYYEKSEDFKKSALRFFLKEKEFIDLHRNIDLDTLETMLNHNYQNMDAEHKDFLYHNRFYAKNLDEKQIDYVMKNHIECDEYATYIKDCKKLNHDLNDKYWKFPSDFSKRFSKIQEEMDNLRKWEKENEGLLYTRAVQSYIKKNPLLKVDGYEIFIPETVEEIKKQADMLRQCLITNNYPQKVINSDCVLVFLQKNGEPIATCELNEKKIVQFRQKGNGCVTEEMEKAMKKWLSKADFKTEKVVQKVA